MNIEVIEKALANKFAQKVTIIKDGSGYNGNGFVVRIGDRELFLRISSSSGFGNELAGGRLDRAINAAVPYSNSVPIHAVFAITEDGEAIGSLINIAEAISIWELIPEGSSNLLESIREKQPEMEKIKRMVSKAIEAIFLIHSEKSVDNRENLYNRATRSIINDGELTPGVWDFLKKNNPGLIKPEQYAKFISNMILCREKAGNHQERLSRIHGDFWGSNLFFDQNEDIHIIDSRTVWGEPAFDLAWFVGEFIMQSLLRADQEFMKVADEAVKKYQELTGDREVKKFMNLPYSFQAFAEAVFTPNLTQDQRLDLFFIANGVLICGYNGEEFNLQDISKYREIGKENLC